MPKPVCGNKNSLESHIFAKFCKKLNGDPTVVVTEKYLYSPGEYCTQENKVI